MHATLLGLLGDDALNHVLTAYYKATILPPPPKQHALRKTDVYFEMIDKVARANKRLHTLSLVVRKAAIEKIRSVFFADIVGAALPLQVSKRKGLNRYLFHDHVSMTSCFVWASWNYAHTRKILKVNFQHSPRHSTAASNAIYALEREGEVVANKLLYISGTWTGRGLEMRETTFATHDYYEIAEAQRTEAQKEEVAAHQKTFEAELFTWLDTSFRDLNAHEFWRTRNHVDLGH